MTRTLRNASVAVELGRGWWRATWTDGSAQAGPFTVAVAAPGGSARRADGGAGRWQVEIGDRDAQPGSWARWRPAGDGVAFSLHVPADGPLVVVEAADAAAGHAVSALVPMEGTGEGGGRGVAVAHGRRGEHEETFRVALAAGPGADELVSAAMR